MIKQSTQAAEKNLFPLTQLRGEKDLWIQKASSLATGTGEKKKNVNTIRHKRNRERGAARLLPIRRCERGVAKEREKRQTQKKDIPTGYRSDILVSGLKRTLVRREGLSQDL